MTNVERDLNGVCIETLREKTALFTCAKMMVCSNPWNALYFTEDQCLEDLKNPALDILGAVTVKHDVIGFLASMTNGIGFEPMIEYLCVRDDFRGCGVGTKLIRHFEDVLFPMLTIFICLYLTSIQKQLICMFGSVTYKLVRCRISILSDRPNFCTGNQGDLSSNEPLSYELPTPVTKSL
jgi:GNAT superfamily N-acetyltransferase